ncbi:hypothetical protein MML48_2g00001858 [Holotrichia oblita]|uniref:Uncharacterized protein n=1 Tax=Holotrichia oblita TaxID=644536 RepID=A0ACB9TMF2_HOLOL|nr:hypothetical protein MML48_2g00001858 [Holotrichia oblita]
MTYSDDVDVCEIYIEPPELSQLTDEDSGDEADGKFIDNLSANQLHAPVELRIAQSESRANASVEEDL